MTNEELRQLNKSRKIYQIAFVTRDLKKAMQAWIDNLGIGPWSVLSFTEETVKDLKVGGKLVKEPFKFLIAISWIGDMQLEIIEPVYGPTIYEDFLKRKGEGLHHIKEQIADGNLATVVAGYHGKDIEVTQTGQFETDFHFYMDTESKVDFIYELGNCPTLKLRPDQFYMYPAEKS